MNKKQSVASSVLDTKSTLKNDRADFFDTSDVFKYFTEKTNLVASQKIISLILLEAGLSSQSVYAFFKRAKKSRLGRKGFDDYKEAIKKRQVQC